MLCGPCGRTMLTFLSFLCKMKPDIGRRETDMTNGYTITIAILLLVLIVLIVRFILMHGSPKTPSCDGNCFGCTVGCGSRFSPEKKQFDEIMNKTKNHEK